MSLKRGGIELSQEQADIVDSVMQPDSITVVSAGAGSGKTRTMVASVLHLVSEKNVSIDDFALITFTNKATDEMRERLESGVLERIEEAEKAGDWDQLSRWFEQKERIASTFIGTIHRFCAMLLRNFGYTELIAHESEIIMASHYFQAALKDTMNEGLEDSTTNILFDTEQVHWAPHVMAERLKSWYEYIRGRGRSITEVASETLRQNENDDNQKYRNAVATMLEKLENNYRELKREKGGVDTNDLLHKCAALVEQHKNQIGPLVASRFRYLFVDEFQDTDELQMNIIQSLAPRLKHVLVVGDRKQAIYGFRGADHSVIRKIAELNNKTPLSLSASRRPTEPLHKAQSVLFDNMGLRYEFLQEKLTQPDDAHVPKDSLVPFQYEHVKTFKDRQGPIIERMVGKIREYVGQRIHDRHKGIRQVEYRDICVLFRSNYQLQSYHSLIPSDIPVVTDTGGGFFRKPEIVACYHMLQAILKYPDDVSLDLALGTPFLPFNAPNSIYRNDGTNLVLRDWFEDEDDCKEWLKGIRNIRKRMKVDLVPQLLTNMYEFTRVREYYGKMGNLQAVANLEKLVMWSRELMNTEALTLQHFFDRLQVALLTGMEMDEADTGMEDTKPNSVRFSTVHSAKGLEYPIVILPDIGRRLLNDEQMPTFFEIPGWGLDLELPGGQGCSSSFNEWVDHYRQNMLEEEARIFYVAVTRAEHVICMIGHGYDKPNPIGDENWSWKDEVLHAGDSLKGLGKKIVKID
ncbi:ATP-dependent helicase [Brevibacillus fluminis]|uniref:DNA 3'-5' helicase n=1 Tax=Brevibacillus fluminis TaxID=511487 RepID=A0A3M8DZ56_9BACL|nr:ATP-dependent helicase [Brevibacillus fluminis]RNB92511.1 ATP-dependent helicase [Brevibacillus fluminis]